MRAWTMSVAFALVWAAAGCSSGDSSASGDDVAVSSSADAGADAATDVDTTQASIAPAVEVTATEPTVAPTVPPTTASSITSPLAVTGVGGLEIVSPTTGVGQRPSFEWMPIDTAVEYSLLVSDAATGAPIWAWRGTATDVALGAGLIDGQEGPRLTGPATLDVFALGATGAIVAASGSVPLTP